ncbi:unnamed protein product, partial [Callosobruchus maculatus]
SFPRDEALRKKWIVALRRKDFVPGTRAVICSKHFKHSDYYQTHMDTLRLKKDAVPSIFDFPRHLLKVEKTRRILTKQSHSHIENSEPSTSCDNPPTVTRQAIVDGAVLSG